MILWWLDWELLFCGKRNEENLEKFPVHILLEKRQKRWGHKTPRRTVHFCVRLISKKKAKKKSLIGISGLATQNQHLTQPLVCSLREKEKIDATWCHFFIIQCDEIESNWPPILTTHQLNHKTKGQIWFTTTPRNSWTEAMICFDGLWILIDEFMQKFELLTQTHLLSTLTFSIKFMPLKVSFQEHFIRIHPACPGEICLCSKWKAIYLLSNLHIFTPDL
jgi:hypothetical protein